MIKLSQEKVMFLHKLLADKTGGNPDLRDEGLLSSALENAYQTFDGKELYPTVEEKASRLCYSLISNHAFVDGNKRIGMLVLLTFLEINGAKISPDNSEVIRIGLGVASGKISYEMLLSWILENRV